MANDVTYGRATILLASPHRITPYHVDADANFLFQLQGYKEFYVYSDARNFMPDTGLESFFMGNPSAAKFSDKDRSAETRYALSPETAVHVPSLFPHWARNLAGVSIALSVNFDLKSVDDLANLYRFNNRLRHHGLVPRPPGRSWMVDGAKLAALKAARLIKKLGAFGNGELPQTVRSQFM